MPRYIIKIKDKYLEWSTVVDAPVTYGGTLEEFKEYYLNEYGSSSLANFEERLERVEQVGTSERGAKNLAYTIGVNRAGPKETCLTEDEIYQKYCVDRPG